MEVRKGSCKRRQTAVLEQS